MVCPKCGLEMKVIRGFNAVTGDNSPESETKLYRVIEHKCENKSCVQKETIRERILLEIVKEKEV